MYPDNPKTTRVDGIGLWRSWTRNFNTKILALLDLIDNSLDAATHNGKKKEEEEEESFQGKVHVFSDTYQPYGGRATTTGLCIINNSIKSIRPLKHVLEVYNSSKVNSGAGDIGENGVGLKQGCAALSDLSFVLVKNGGRDRIELGIVAKRLQRVDGCYLPAFSFSNDERSELTLQEQMMSFFSEPNRADVARCIAQYGAARSEGEPNLSVGVERLCEHFNCKAFDDPYVFMIILDKVHNDEAMEYVGSAVDAQQKITVNRLLKDLAEVIPRTYLHVPQSFSFIIGEDRIKFDYWPKRLIELSSITLHVNKKIPWQNKFELPNHNCTYPMRVFLGFDGMRITDPLAGKECSLYVYSRQSGRMISKHADARTRLGLLAGGTDYCQGLTVIIDDFGGNLPLNPTKQEVAFGEESHGTIHEENLMAWVGCVAQFYYKFHLKKFSNKKTILTREVAKFGDSLLDKRRQLKPLDDCSLTTFVLSYKSSIKNIRVDKTSVEEIVGPDTIHRIIPIGKQSITKTSKDTIHGTKRKASDSQQSHTLKKKKTPSSPLPQAISPRKKRYAEESNSEEDSKEENCQSPLQRRVGKSNEKSKATEQPKPDNQGIECIDYEHLCSRLTAKTNEYKARNRVLECENRNLRNEIKALKDKYEKGRFDYERFRVKSEIEYQL